MASVYMLPRGEPSTHTPAFSHPHPTSNIAGDASRRIPRGSVGIRLIHRKLRSITLTLPARIARESRPED